MSSEKSYAIKYIESPIGKLGIVANDNAVVEILFPGEKTKSKALEKDTPVLKQAASELKEYFAGKLKKFSVKLAPQGTEFQKSAWKALTKIPHGKTASYQEQAAKLGMRKNRAQLVQLMAKTQFRLSFPATALSVKTANSPVFAVV